ncbi:hypothetical protein ACLB2K_034287 [Fragaria x ananassa]
MPRKISNAETKRCSNPGIAMEGFARPRGSSAENHKRERHRSRGLDGEILSHDRMDDDGTVAHIHSLKAVVKEAMRLHHRPPVTPLVPKESKEKCILGGYEVRKTNRGLINAYGIGRDPDVWDNPP